MTDAAVRSVYRAIWNSDYDADVSLKGRTAAHALAEQMAGALAQDGLLASPMAEGLDYSALADACDDYLHAYRGDGPDERIGVAAARVRGAAGPPAAPAPPTDVIEEAAAILAARHSDRPWQDLSTHRQEFYRQDARALATAGLLAAPQQPEIPGPERDRLYEEAKTRGLAEAYLERRGEKTWIRAARVIRAVHNHLPGRAPIGLREAKVLGEAIVVAFEDNGPVAPADDEATRAITEVAEELSKAQVKFAPFNSTHEGYAVILEELDELWAEVKANDVPRSIEEAVQVAAMALRYIVDCRAALAALREGQQRPATAGTALADELWPLPATDRETLLDVLTTADEDLHNEHGGDGALMNRNYLEYLADRLIAAGAIAGTP